MEPGVVAHSAGVLAASSSGRRADLAPRDGAAMGAAGEAPPFTNDSLRRGRGRYDVYCAPCHSVSGDGDGMVVRRGFPAPLSLDSAPMRSASDAHFFDVITNGHGVMYAFADRIGPADRWAIVGYLRALQRSQHAAIGDVPLPSSRRCVRRSLDMSAATSNANTLASMPAGSQRLRRRAARRRRPPVRPSLVAVIFVRLAVHAGPLARQSRLGRRARSDRSGTGVRDARPFLPRPRCASSRSARCSRSRC